MYSISPLCHPTGNCNHYGPGCHVCSNYSNFSPILTVYVTAPRFSYQATEGNLKGMLVEHSMSQEYLAKDDAVAIKSAIAWARNRYEEVIKDMYPGSFLSSIKVYHKVITEARDNGYIDTKSAGCFFEWKYDWPGTLDQLAEARIQEILKFQGAHT